MRSNSPLQDTSGHIDLVELSETMTRIVVELNRLDEITRLMARAEQLVAQLPVGLPRVANLPAPTLVREAGR